MTEISNINTARLRLTALTLEQMELQLNDPMAFFNSLGVEPEPAWPPFLLDEDKMKLVIERMRANPENIGWHVWVYVSPILNRLVGVGGFNGPPNEFGEVDIEYSMLISYREQGLATEGVHALLDWALDHPALKRINAQTRSDRVTAQRVLEKLGFVEGSRRREEGQDFEYISWGRELKVAAA